MRHSNLHQVPVQRHADQTRFFNTAILQKNTKIKSNQTTDCLRNSELHLNWNMKVEIHIGTTTLNEELFWIQLCLPASGGSRLHP